MAGIAEAGLTSLSGGPNIRPGIPGLTTTFTYASSCGSQWVQLWPDLVDWPSSSIVFSGTSYGSYFIACQPSSTYQFSPGLCPSGHYIATITEYTVTEEIRIWGASCCGNNLTFVDKQCTSIFTKSGLTVYRPRAIHWYGSRTRADGDIYIFKETNTSWDANFNTTVLSYGTMIADPVQIFWQASDLSLFDPPYASALASRLRIDSTPTGTLGRISSQSATPGSTSSISEPTSPASSPNLSPSATAGISLGAISGAAILATAIFFIIKWRKRKGRAEDTQEEEGPNGTDAPEVAELHDSGQQANELEVQEKINELPSPVAELDGGSVWKDR